MKKLLLVSALVILGTFNSFASHLMGGEITYVHIGGDEYEVTLVVYRDCFGIPVSTSQNVTFESASCGENFSVVFPLLNTIDVSQVCVGQTTTCNGGTLPGTEQNIYKDTITMAPCSDWVIHWNNGTRNAGIDNLVNPGGVNIFVRATLDNIVGAQNNSPQYLALPTPYLCSGQLNIFNHGASDADGDSIYYELAQPLDVPGPIGTPIPFTAGYSIADPIITTAGMNLNPATGEMCFTPSQAQICVVSVLISEYRSGTLIGTQIREMQVVVENNCANQAPFAGTSAPTCGATGGMQITTQGPSVTQIDSNSIVMCPDDSVCFTVQFTDPNGDNVNVSSNIAAAIPGANFTITGNGTPSPVGVFCWIPTPLDSGINILTVSLQDDGCPITAAQYYTYDITIYDQPYAGEDQIICGDQEAQLQAVGGGGYIWSVISGDTDLSHLSCTNCSDPLVSPAVTTTYLLTSTQAAACENTDTITVFRVPDFDPEAYGDTALCDYLSHQIGVNILSGPAGTYTYLWNNGLTLSNDSIANPIASPNGTTQYIVEVESPDGCVKQEDTVTIIVTPPPFVQLTPGDITVCQGEIVQFGVESSCLYTLGLYDTFGDGWNNQSLDVYSNGVLVGNYTVLPTDNNGDSLSVTFPVINGNSLEIVYNTGAFQNESWYILTDGTGGVAHTIAAGGMTGLITGDTLFAGTVNCGPSLSDSEFSWNPIANLDVADTINPLFTGNALGPNTYNVTITDTSSGCSIDRNQTITVVPDYTLNSTQSDTNICLGETVDFFTESLIAGTYTYSWSPAGIMDNDTIQDPTATFMTPGVNTVLATVSSAGGCTKTDTFIVNVSYGFQPDITMVPDTALICGGDSAWLNIDLGGGIPAQCGISATNSCSGATTQLTVGAGTTNLGAPTPYYGFFEDNRVQMIYEASELNALGFTGGKITEVEFNILTKASSAPYENFNIKMGCTSIADFSGATQYVPGLVQVYNNPSYTSAAGWNTHILDNAYEWDGVSNLIVEVCFDNSAWTSTDNVAQTATALPLTLAQWTDGAIGCTLNAPNTYTQRPNIRITTCPTTPDSNLYYYAWTPSLGLSSDSVKTPLVFPTGPTTYYVTVTDTLGGCFDTDSVFVTIGDDFNVTATGDTSVCIYNGIAESFQLGASAFPSTGETYVWNNAATLNNAFIANPIASPTTTTQYIVTVTNTSGCVREDTVTIEVFNTNLPITITGNTDFCEGDSTQLSLTGYDTYSWYEINNPTTIISTTNSTFVTAGSYAVDVTLNGCDATTDTIVINEIIIIPPVLSDTTFCENDVVTIDAGAGFNSYQWIPSGGTNQFGSFNAEGNYAVIVELSGCSDTSNTVFVGEIPLPSPVIIGDTNYCGTGGTALSVNNVYNSYNWSTSSVTNTTNAFAVNGGPTTITLTVDSLGCTSTVSVDITNPQANPQIVIPSPICPDSTIEVFAAGGPFGNYTWSNGSGATSTVVGPGPITLTVEKDGCTFQVTETVQSFPLPVADFTIAPATSGQPNVEILFTDASAPSGSISNWIWDFDATNPTSASGGLGEGPFSWVYNAQGTYTITLTVIDDNGCQHSTTQDYLIFSDIVSPNIITPNGDGLNDFLVFENLDISVFSNNLTVFNRWGNEVFQQNDYQNNWNGGDLSDGTYFYILEVNYADGPETFKGSLNILR